VQGLYQSITLNLFQGNSLTCVTPTKILLLLNHLKTITSKHFTDMPVCSALLNGLWTSEASEKSICTA